MRRIFLVFFLIVTGCSSGTYHLPAKEYRQQIKTLGVLPLMVDSRSQILHPDSREIFALLQRSAEDRSQALVDDLRKKKGYFDVRLIQQPSRILAETLLVKAEIDELGEPRGYQLNNQLLAEICKDSVVDGLLLLTLQAVVHNDKRWSRKTLETLVTDYNDIMASASVVAADGRVLWELNGEDAEIILSLQYPDFDEAYFNRDTEVKLKFIGTKGLEKTLFPVTGKEEGKLLSPQITAWLEKVAAALSPKFFR